MEARVRKDNVVVRKSEQITQAHKPHKISYLDLITKFVPRILLKNPDVPRNLIHLSCSYS